MIFYWLALLLCVGGYLYSFWSLAKKNVGVRFQDQRVWMKEKSKFFIAGLIVVVALTIVIFHKPLNKTIWCAYKGHEHSVETRYNWISGVCSYKGPNNTWIPITRLLGFPEGDSNKEKDVVDAQSDTNAH